MYAWHASREDSKWSLPDGPPQAQDVTQCKDGFSLPCFTVAWVSERKRWLYYHAPPTLRTYLPSMRQRASDVLPYS